jgi:hypothetical protein
MRLHLYTLAVVALCASAARADGKHELSLAAGVDSAYDDNVYNGRGPDYVNRINPHVAWRYLDRRLEVAAAYDFAYWTYAFGKAKNSLNHRADFAFAGRLSRRVTLKLSDEFTRAEDPGFINRIGVVAPQIGILDNTADAQLGVAITRRLYGAVEYTYHHTSFDPYNAAELAAGMPPLFDGDEHDVQAAGSFRVTRLDDFRLGFRGQAFTAGPQHVSAERWSIGASYSPTVGWRHQFLRELEANADIGPVFFQSLPDAVNVPASPDSGTTWRLSARLRYYTPLWRASASFTRDLLGGTGLGTAAWADYAYAQAGFHWLERFDASVGFGYFRNGRAVDQPFAYDGVTVDALADWRVIDNLRLGAYYTLRWQEVGPGAIGPGMTAAQFPNVVRNIVGVRVLAVLGADARPPRREVHE